METFEFDGLQYEILENEVRVAKKMEEREKFVIPETVLHKSKTYPVVEIGEDAFREEHYTRPKLSLKEITFPKGLRKIGENALRNCFD